MGIDVYLKWNNQTESEEEAQFTGFSVENGHTGYLREAYHGGPYATKVLFSEDWNQEPDGGFSIPAAELRKRLPETVLTAIHRHQAIYEKNKHKEDGSFNQERDFATALAKTLSECSKASKPQNLTSSQVELEAIEKLISTRELPKYALSYVDFVELAERVEEQTGEPCRVVISW
jgi:hypothetical protein